MALSRRTADRPRPRDGGLPRTDVVIADWAADIFLLLFALRIVVTAPILGLVVDYEGTQGGSVLTKVHPGSWGILLFGALIVPSIMSRVSGPDRKLFNAMLIFIVLIALVVLESLALGRTSALGYLLDSLISASVSGMIVLVMSDRKRRVVANIVLIFCLINACISIGEFALHRHILPDSRYADLFRPNGMAGHPLETGLWCVLSLMLLWFVRWPYGLRMVAAVLIMACVASAGARLATAIVAAMFGLAVVMPPSGKALITGRSVQNMLVAAIAVAIAAPFTYFILDAMGLLYRFQALGFFDSSAQSRLSIYSILGMVSTNQLLLGFPVETATDMLFRLTQSKLIESSIAIYILQFGLIGASFLVVGYLLVVWNFIKRANRFLVVAIIGFWIAAGGTLVLSGKSAGLTAFFALCVALRTSPRHREPSLSLMKTPTATALRVLPVQHVHDHP